MYKVQNCKMQIQKFVQYANWTVQYTNCTNCCAKRVFYQCKTRTAQQIFLCKMDYSVGLNTK